MGIRAREGAGKMCEWRRGKGLSIVSHLDGTSSLEEQSMASSVTYEEEFDLEA